MALQDITNKIDVPGSLQSAAKSTPVPPGDGIPLHWDAIARAKWTATKFYCRVRFHVGVTYFSYMAPYTRYVVRSG